MGPKLLAEMDKILEYTDSGLDRYCCAGRTNDFYNRMKSLFNLLLKFTYLS